MAINRLNRTSTVGIGVRAAMRATDSAVSVASIRSFPNHAVSIRTDSQYAKPALNGPNRLIPYFEMVVLRYTQRFRLGTTGGAVETTPVDEKGFGVPVGN